MDNIYLALVVLLFVLAISDLVVGVSNDAVNFLNSAFGSKVASVKVILIIASLGILAGATFSNGMMEVARKGIFHPDLFFFSEIMIIFLAVMITDVILLDTFNTFGMPTSTTVSIVFELLGAAVAVTLIKTMTDSQALPFVEYINTGKALVIIFGILLSVVVAFTVGAIVQFISRMLFSFDYEKRIRYFGAVFGGVAITAITYFILIKGAKGASFMSDDIKNIIKDNTWTIICLSMIVWTVVLQIITKLFKIDVLKLVVLVGTFALAMAFAGNDLVNFIGVPLAGFESFKAFIATPGATPDGLLMSALSGKVQTPIIFLLIAGLIMVITLTVSKKARSVTKTEINLARQHEGYERFETNILARSLVRSASGVVRFGRKHLPEGVKSTIKKQFDLTLFHKKQKLQGANAPSFDMIRASINLVVASTLIALATSLKLPLSTTYVTFMVAMGTSLADQAWGRESAVYRISGVLSVIGGWFFTAFSAFTAAFILAFIIYFGGMVALGGLTLLVAYFIYRTHHIHKDRSIKSEKKQTVYETEGLNDLEILNKTTAQISSVFADIDEIISITFDSFYKEDLKDLRGSFEKSQEIREYSKIIKRHIDATVKSFKNNPVEAGHYYVQLVNSLREMTHCISYMIKPLLDHVDNHHKPLINIQMEELKEINENLKTIFIVAIKIIEAEDYDSTLRVIDGKNKLVKLIDEDIKKQIKRIKSAEVGTKNSLVYMKVLGEVKNLVLYITKLVKEHKDFTESIR